MSAERPDLFSDPKASCQQLGLPSPKVMLPLLMIAQLALWRMEVVGPGFGGAL